MVVIFCSVFSLKLCWNAGEIGNVSVFFALIMVICVRWQDYGGKFVWIV